MDWVLPTDEILARVEKLVEEERKASALKPAAVTSGDGKAVSSHKPHNDFMSRLFKFALTFKRNLRTVHQIPARLEPPGGSAG